MVAGKDKDILYCLSSIDVSCCKRRMVKMFNKILIAKAIGPSTRSIFEDRSLRMLSIESAAGPEESSSHLFVNMYMLQKIAMTSHDLPEIRIRSYNSSRCWQTHDEQRAFHKQLIWLSVEKM